MATASFAMESSSGTCEPLYFELLDRYFRDAAAPTLQEFIELHEEEIARQTRQGENIKAVWSTRYSAGAQKHAVSYVIGRPNWAKLALKAISISPAKSYEPTSVSGSSSGPSSQLATSEATSSSSSGTTSSGTTHPVDLQVIEARYDSITEESMWKLSSGKVVEDTMKQYAMTCTSEHLAHSLILDVNDPLWVRDGYFTEAEMKEITEYNHPILPEFPDDLNDYLGKYDDKYTLDDIFEVAEHKLFHPKKDPELHWIHGTISSSLDLFFHKYLPLNDHTEQDIMTRVWRFVQESFDESVFDVRCGEKSSGASSEARNNDRTLTGTGLSRKAIGKKVDMLVKCINKEYACSEAGKSQTADSTKELVESNFVCPKTLRDMLCQLTSTNPSKLHHIATVGYIFTGLRMTCLTLTCPKGNICRLQKIGPLEFPDDQQNFVARIKALIRLVWKMKAILKSSLSTIQRSDEDLDPTFKKPALKCPIIPSYHHQQPSRKRKRVVKSATKDTDNS